MRRRIGYVSQSAFVLSGTILDNLRYGSQEASQVQVEIAPAWQIFMISSLVFPMDISPK